LNDLARLLRTTSFRLVLAYVAVFLASASLLSVLVYLHAENLVQAQLEATIDAEIGGLAEQYHRSGMPGLVATIAERSLGSRDRRSVYLLAAPNFRPLAGNLDGFPAEPPDVGNRLRFDVQSPAAPRADPIPVLARVFVLPGGFRLLVGRSTADVALVMGAIRSTMIAGIAGVALLGLLGGVFTSRQVLRRVEKLGRSLGRIMKGDMSERVPLAGSGDEFDQLSERLNDMLAEFEALVASVRSVTDNVAHDLRIPLNRIRARIELELSRPEPPSRAVLEQSLADIEALLATFNGLLTIAQAEAGERAMAFDSVDLGAALRDIAELYEPLAQDKQVRLDNGAPDALVVRGNRPLLTQALANLIDNAVKYTPAGGSVRLSGMIGADGVRIGIADSGPGIPLDQRVRVFERFYRLDTTRSTPGSGLGLSLVKAVMDAHGARITLSDAEPGLRVELIFPPR
jgi:signal transduction histidine kinase